ASDKGIQDRSWIIRNGGEYSQRFANPRVLQVLLNQHQCLWVPIEGPGCKVLPQPPVPEASEGGSPHRTCHLGQPGIFQPGECIAAQNLASRAFEMCNISF